MIKDWALKSASRWLATVTIHSRGERGTLTVQRTYLKVLNTCHPGNWCHRLFSIIGDVDIFQLLQDSHHLKQYLDLRLLIRVLNEYSRQFGLAATPPSPHSPTPEPTQHPGLCSQPLPVHAELPRMLPLASTTSTSKHTHTHTPVYV